VFWAADHCTRPLVQCASTAPFLARWIAARRRYGARPSPETPIVELLSGTVRARDAVSRIGFHGQQQHYGVFTGHNLERAAKCHRSNRQTLRIVKGKLAHRLTHDLARSNHTRPPHIRHLLPISESQQVSCESKRTGVPFQVHEQASPNTRCPCPRLEKPAGRYVPTKDTTFEGSGHDSRRPLGLRGRPDKMPL